jgi:hypothetical protein
MLPSVIGSIGWSKRAIRPTRPAARPGPRGHRPLAQAAGGVAINRATKQSCRDCRPGDATCEGCQSLDIRQLHQKDLLQPGLRLPWSWTRKNELAGTISIETEHDALVLIYRSHRFGSTEWRDVRQRVPITWTECHLGGRRPWFKCDAYSNGLYCGRRVTTIYNGGDFFCVPALLWPGLCEPTGTGARTRDTHGAENRDALGRR